MTLAPWCWTITVVGPGRRGQSSARCSYNALRVAKPGTAARAMSVRMSGVCVRVRIKVKVSVSMRVGVSVSVSVSVRVSVSGSVSRVVRRTEPSSYGLQKLSGTGAGPWFWPWTMNRAPTPVVFHRKGGRARALSRSWSRGGSWS